MYTPHSNSKAIPVQNKIKSATNDSGRWTSKKKKNIKAKNRSVCRQHFHAVEIPRKKKSCSNNKEIMDEWMG